MRRDQSVDRTGKRGRDAFADFVIASRKVFSGPLGACKENHVSPPLLGYQIRLQARRCGGRKDAHNFDRAS